MMKTAKLEYIPCTREGHTLFVPSEDEVYTMAEKRIGTGHSCECLSATNKANQRFALKKMRENMFNDHKQEVEYMKMCKSDYVVELHAVYMETTEEGMENIYYLRMELCEGGELFDKMVDPNIEITEECAKEYMWNIIEGLAHIHEQKITHRDMKPENIFLKKGKAKIGDLGLADGCVTRMYKRVGTAYYIAPEVLKRNYTYKCDIWSIGVICYILLCGFPPFYGNDDRIIYEMITDFMDNQKEVDFSDSSWDTVSENAKDFIRRMLCKEDDRATTDELFAHPWFEEIRAKSVSDNQSVESSAAPVVPAPVVPAPVVPAPVVPAPVVPAPVVPAPVVPAPVVPAPVVPVPAPVVSVPAPVVSVPAPVVPVPAKSVTPTYQQSGFGEYLYYLQIQTYNRKYQLEQLYRQLQSSSKKGCND